MNGINIDQLSEAELIDLNRRIVERLRFMSQARAHKRMLDFRVGERVMFDVEGRAPVFGVLTRYNKQTVTVTTDSGHQWRVSPGFLQKVESVIEAELEQAVSLPAKQQ